MTVFNLSILRSKNQTADMISQYFKSIKKDQEPLDVSHLYLMTDAYGNSYYTSIIKLLIESIDYKKQEEFEHCFDLIESIARRWWINIKAKLLKTDFVLISGNTSPQLDLFLDHFVLGFSHLKNNIPYLVTVGNVIGDVNCNLSEPININIETVKRSFIGKEKKDPNNKLFVSTSFFDAPCIGYYCEDSIEWKSHYKLSDFIASFWGNSSRRSVEFSTNAPLSKEEIIRRVNFSKMNHGLLFGNIIKGLESFYNN